MRIFLDPTETLLFRTGRSFDAGESGFAETLFPPTPETLQGAIRAAIASYWDPSKTLEEVFSEQDLTNLIGSRGSGYGRFRITGLALGRRQDDKAIERLFPPPTHLYTVKDAQNNARHLLLKPQKKTYLRSSDLTKDLYCLFPENEGEGKRKPFEGWLTERGLEKVLHLNTSPGTDDIVLEEEIYRREPRLGIGMDNATKTTREGFLYQTQMIRMQPGYGFVIDIRLRKPSISQDTPYSESLMDDAQTQQELRLPDQGWVMLGGERRMARFEVLPSQAEDQKSSLEELKKGKMLYLATPAAFDGGWQPNQWVQPLVPPITAAINRYQSIGGWELNPKDSGGSNKTMRRCVPAGSVYFFQQSVSVTHPLTDHGLEIGYGITYTGEWKE